MELNGQPPFIDTDSKLPTFEDKFLSHSQSISGLNANQDRNDDNVDVSNSSHDAEHNSHFWTMPSPPDVPLPPSYWSKVSNSGKAANDLKSNNKTKDNQEKNLRKTNEKSFDQSTIFHRTGNSAERNQRSSGTRLDNRFKLNHNNDLPRPAFERPNFNELPNLSQYPPCNQIQPQIHPAYQPVPFMQFQRVVQPSGFPINVMTPYMCNPRMPDSSYIQYPSYSPMPGFQPVVVNRAPIPQFPLISNPNAQVFNPIMNYENNNRFNSPLMQSSGERTRSDSSRFPVRRDLSSHRSNTSHHNANQSKRFIPPQVSRMRRS